MAGREQEPQRPQLPAEIERIKTRAAIDSGKDISMEATWSTDPTWVSRRYSHLSTPRGKEFTEVDEQRHEWHKANAAGFRLANEIEKSFGKDAKKAPQKSVHELPASSIKEWADYEEAATMLHHDIRDNGSYSVEVTHEPAKKGSPKVDRMTLHGDSWAYTLDIQHGKVSYQHNEGHKLIISNGDNKSGEATIKNAEFSDIQAFADLLSKAKDIRRIFPPPLDM